MAVFVNKPRGPRELARDVALYHFTRGQELFAKYSTRASFKAFLWWHLDPEGLKNKVGIRRNMWKGWNSARVRQLERLAYFQSVEPLGVE